MNEFVELWVAHGRHGQGKRSHIFLDILALNVSPLYCIKPTEKYMESMSREH